MTKENIKDAIIELIEEYFEDNDEDVSDCFTIIYSIKNHYIQ